MSYGSSSYGSGCGGGYSRSSGYSKLESIAGSYSSHGSDYNSDTSYFIANAEKPLKPAIFDNTDVKPFSQYANNSYKNEEYTRASRAKYYVGADVFLKPNRAWTPFIGEISEIKDLIEEAFEKTVGFSFPDDIIVELLDEDGMKKAHQFSKNIHGFAINRRSQGLISSVFVRKGELAKVMITLGHEIGHALSLHARDKILEEAKAFAFQFAWMKILKENNIGNLGTQIELDRPAVNGIHNVAFDFVLEQIQEGRDAYDVYLDIVSGRLK